MAESPSIDGNTVDIVATDQRKVRKKRVPDKSFRKAPGAPKRFKSPYILFSIHRMDQHRQQLGKQTNITMISKLVSDEWKTLSESDRLEWSERARFDKERFNAEKSLYTGPWQIPSKRKRKDPSAPRRPMSAFLLYSQKKRKEVKDAHPDLKNTDLSRMLGVRWKSASDEERLPFIEREKNERDVYNRDIAEWRRQKEKEDKAILEHRKLVTDEWIKSGLHTEGMVGTCSQVYAPAHGTVPDSFGQHVNQISQFPIQKPLGNNPMSASLPPPPPPPRIPTAMVPDLRRMTPDGQQSPGPTPAGITPPASYFGTTSSVAIDAQTAAKAMALESSMAFVAHHSENALFQSGNSFGTFTLE